MFARVLSVKDKVLLITESIFTAVTPLPGAPYITLIIAPDTEVVASDNDT